MFMDKNYDCDGYYSTRNQFAKELRNDLSKPEPVLSYRDEVIEEEQIDLRSIARLYPHKEEQVLRDVDDEMLFLATQDDVSSLNFKANGSICIGKKLGLDHYMSKLCNSDSNDNPYEYRTVLAKYMEEKEAPSILEIKLTSRIMTANNIATPFHVDCIDLVYFGLSGLIGRQKAIELIGDLLLIKLKSKSTNSIFEILNIFGGLR